MNLPLKDTKNSGSITNLSKMESKKQVGLKQWTSLIRSLNNWATMNNYFSGTFVYLKSKRGFHIGYVFLDFSFFRCFNGRPKYRNLTNSVDVNVHLGTMLSVDLQLSPLWHTIYTRSDFLSCMSISTELRSLFYFFLVHSIDSRHVSTYTCLSLRLDIWDRWRTDLKLHWAKKFM